jgi:peptidyl-prolyl cis-trans isomerase C
MLRKMACLMLAAVGCSSPPSAHDAGGPFELSVGERRFTSAEVDALVQSQPEALQAHYRSENGRAAFVEQLIRSEVLVQEARRKRLDEDPSIRSMVDRMLIQKLVEQLELPTIDEAQLKAAYEAAQNEFIRPDRFHVRAIFWASPKGSTDYAAVETRARAAQKKLSGLKGAAREATFEAMARAETAYLPSRESGGDLGPRTPEELATLLGHGIEGSVVTMQQPGQLSEVITTDRGLVLLLLRGRQPGLTQTFESVKPRLLQRLSAEARTKALENLVARLKGETKIQVSGVRADAGL